MIFELENHYVDTARKTAGGTNAFARGMSHFFDDVFDISEKWCPGPRCCNSAITMAYPGGATK